ncbi:MAG: hypothetical protein H6625_13175 [Bdellovibrionaceae bacterium]|nr:hypothetical protein [Pseudobdellovibrionaceae bacterium]
MVRLLILSLILLQVSTIHASSNCSSSLNSMFSDLDPANETAQGFSLLDLSESKILSSSYITQLKIALGLYALKYGIEKSERNISFFKIILSEQKLFTFGLRHVYHHAHHAQQNYQALNFNSSALSFQPLYTLSGLISGKVESLIAELGEEHHRYARTTLFYSEALNPKLPYLIQSPGVSTVAYMRVFVSLFGDGIRVYKIKNQQNPLNFSDLNQLIDYEEINYLQSPDQALLITAPERWDELMRNHEQDVLTPGAFPTIYAPHSTNKPQAFLIIDFI